MKSMNLQPIWFLKSEDSLVKIDKKDKYLNYLTSLDWLKKKSFAEKDEGVDNIVNFDMVERWYQYFVQYLVENIKKVEQE